MSYGVFDSSFKFPNATLSEKRTVQIFELELHTRCSPGISLNAEVGENGHRLIVVDVVGIHLCGGVGSVVQLRDLFGKIAGLLRLYGLGSGRTDGRAAGGTEFHVILELGSACGTKCRSILLPISDLLLCLQKREAFLPVLYTPL